MEYKFTMIQYIIRFSLQLRENIRESTDNYIHAFDSECFKQCKLLDNAKHFNQLLNTFAERIKFTENVPRISLAVTFQRNRIAFH
jgi:hypothetical protein